MITHVAIRNINTGTVYALPEPARHNDVIELMTIKGFRLVTHTANEFGFLADGQFLTRKEAKKVAGPQLLESASESDDLFSEDIW